MNRCETPTAGTARQILNCNSSFYHLWKANRHGLCPWKCEQMDKTINILQSNATSNETIVPVIHNWLICFSFQWQKVFCFGVWCQNPSELWSEYLPLLLPSVCFSCMHNLSGIKHIVYSYANQMLVFFTTQGLYGNQADFHYPFYDTICHSVKISHLKLITEFIFIHKPLVPKYQLVLRK